MRWAHSAVDYLAAAVGGALECRGVAVCVSGTMSEEGGIVLALVVALETLVSVCQEVLLTDSGWRLHRERWGEQEMKQLEGGLLAYTTFIIYCILFDRCHKDTSQ